MDKKWMEVNVFNEVPGYKTKHTNKAVFFYTLEAISHLKVNMIYNYIKFFD